MARTSGSDRTRDVPHRVLASPERRRILSYLADHDGEATFADLVEALTDDPDPTMASMRLYHVHLPKLTATEAVDWAADTGAVRLTSGGHRTLASADGSDLPGQAMSD